MKDNDPKEEAGRLEVNVICKYFNMPTVRNGINCLQIMPFHTFQVYVRPQILLAPISCNAYNLKVFFIFLCLHFLKVNQKRELDTISRDRSKRHKAESRTLSLHKYILKLPLKPRISENTHSGLRYCT